MEALDLDLVNELFAKIQRKSGVHEAHIARVPRDAIIFDTKKSGFEKNMGTYTQAMYLPKGEAGQNTRGRLDLNWRSAYVEGAFTGRGGWRGVLATFVHESTHFVSNNHQSASSDEERMQLREGMTDEKWDEHPDNEPLEYCITGFHEYWDMKNGMHDVGFLINEAVTEKLSQEVVAEYTRVKGLKKPDPRDMPLRTVGDAYKEERKALEALILSMADALETEPEQIWRSIVQAYFSNRGIYNFVATTEEILGLKKSSKVAEYLLNEDADKKRLPGKALREMRKRASQTLRKQIEKAVRTITREEAARLSASLGL